MSEVEVTERLNQLIDAIVKGNAPGHVDQTVVELTALAETLRDLPRAQFKSGLREELEKEVSMSASAATKRKVKLNEPRPVWRRVTPYMIVPDVHQEIDFIKKVFAAKGKVYGLGSQGGYHSEYRIGESLLMIGGGGKGAKWQGAAAPLALHVYVEDTDDVYRRAIKAGAASLVPPTDMTYGERSAAIEDVSGNHWYLATAFGKHHVPHGLPNLMPVFHPRGAQQMVDFLESAFAAEPLAVYRTGRGIVKHAQLRIGESIVEMGEAHGQWQPRSMHFMLNVADCDSAFKHAMKAEGATLISEPANAPYGGRSATIQDPFGNTWYLNSPTPKQIGK
jgi:uncharacterized glyoxalase superfamily protein PhnB